MPPERNSDLALFLQTAQEMLSKPKLMNRDIWRNLALLHASKNQEMILADQRQRLSKAIAQIVFTFEPTLFLEEPLKMGDSIVIKARKERRGYSPLFAKGLPNVRVTYNGYNAEHVTLQYIPYPSVSGSITSSASFWGNEEGVFDFISASTADVIPLMSGIGALPFIERERLISVVSLVSDMICATELRPSLQVVSGDIDV